MYKIMEFKADSGYGNVGDSNPAPTITAIPKANNWLEVNKKTIIEASCLESSDEKVVLWVKLTE